MPGFPIRQPVTPGPDPGALGRARREAARQLEWAEAYLAAAETIETGDPAHSGDARRLRAEVAQLRERLRRPRIV